jgi:2-dehydro-3-deoxyphosphogluconate aldolase / (4S)-4-hydroxy-2-oxoglutarate aldolase
MNVPGQTFEARLRRERLLPILRLDDAGAVPRIVRALGDAGLSLAEVSLSTSGGRDALVAAVQAGGDRVLVGAGTVRTRRDVEFALAAGAGFVIGPGFSAEVDTAARRADIPYLPGVMTPTEVDSALQAGRELVKLFPASTLGASYVRELLGPFPEARVVAVGGIDAQNAADFLESGAYAVAVAGALIGPNNGADVEAVSARAVQLSDVVHAVA